ncbi:MAG: glycoside hydrolase family 11 protein [Ruminococcus sp.]|nr:glycoside hydrolase family 11 protein [Ruminococcus sp.]
MNNKLFRKAVSGIVGLALCLSCLPAIPSANAYQETGTKDGYDYELWNQDGIGSASMDVGSNGTFSCSWSGIENCLFRTGNKLGSTKDYKAYNGMYIDYDVDYEPKGNSYMCIYGWTENGSGEYPTVEYYIVEAWGSWRPPGSADSLGTVEANGNTYDIYRTVRNNQPSIHGTETFYQYWSVRRDNPAMNNMKKNISGRISISKHFEAWEKAGLDMSGKMYEVALNIEGYQSNGSAVVNKNGLVIGDGDGDNGSAPIKPVEPVEPDANGYFFNSTFENGTDNWAGRGAASVKQDSGCLSVTGRTDSWNGACISLDTAAFNPGKNYGFSVKAKQDSTASENFKLTLQCTVDGEDQYLNIASAAGAKGEWVTLSNPSFTIPEGASNLILYVETDGTTTDFVIDDAVGAVENKIPSSSGTQDPGKVTPGDLNGDGRIDAYDIILERKAIVNSFSGASNNAAADVDSDGTVSINDLVLLSKYVLGGIDKFPQPQQPAVTTAPTTPAVVTTTKPASQPSTGDKSYMDSIKNSITNSVPANISGSANNGCREEKIEYYSSVAKKNKKAVVILPPNYTASKSYPVVYVNHGIFGSESDMVGYCKTIGGNLMASGEAEEMILVSCAMYTSQNTDQCQGFTSEECAKYDAFREDLIECLMPYMEEHYSIKTGRENTGICGFSMGGRESLYIGITRPQYFGYIGAACPAPGITPAQDSFMTHPGNMQPSEFKIQDHAYDPYLLMITGGSNDNVVGTFPQQYHETLTANGQPHIWQEIQGGGHDQSCVNPLMYNFLKNAFKAE